MGPVEFIGAAAKGAAKFASKHTVLTAMAVTAGIGGYFAYDHYKGADGANGGGAVMKQDVAVNDAKGDLRVKVQGTKAEAAKTGSDNSNNEGDGSTTETDKGTLSDDNDASESKGKTANSPNNNGETEPGTKETPVNVATTTNVEDTVSTVAAPRETRKLSKKDRYFARKKELETQEVRRREKYLDDLQNAL